MFEDTISLNTAKLAKLKGFNEVVIEWFEKKEGKQWTEEYPPHYDFGYSNYNNCENKLSKPTQYSLQKWIRKQHNIDIEIKVYLEDSDSKSYCFELIYENIENKEQKKLINRLIRKDSVYMGGGYYENYEEALEEALRKALLLIK